MRGRREQIFIRARLAQSAPLNDLRRGQMLHAVAAIIRAGVDQKRVIGKLRRAPHPRLCADDLFEVAHKLFTSARFAAEGVQDDVISAPV